MNISRQYTNFQSIFSIKNSFYLNSPLIYASLASRQMFKEEPISFLIQIQIEADYCSKYFI